MGSFYIVDTFFKCQVGKYMVVLFKQSSLHSIYYSYVVYKTADFFFFFVISRNSDSD